MLGGSACGPVAGDGVIVCLSIPSGPLPHQLAGATVTPPANGHPRERSQGGPARQERRRHG